MEAFALQVKNGVSALDHADKKLAVRRKVTAPM